MKIWLRRIVTFICIFALCGAVLWSVWRLWFDPYRGTVHAFSESESLETVLTTEQAVYDLDYIVDRLKERHPACISGLPVNVQTAYDRERENIAHLSEVPVLSLWQSAARILSSLGDAHTSVGVYYENSGCLPLDFVWENDALRCSGGGYDGYTVIEIGDIPVDSLYEQFKSQFSYELESWARYSFASRLNRGEYLAFAGADTRGEILLLLESPDDGERFTVPFTLGETVAAAENTIESSFEYSVSSGVGIFTLRQCDYDEEYKHGLRAFFTEVQEQNAHSVIIDLRGNPGGNSLVADEFVRYLPAKSYQAGTCWVRFGPVLWKNKPQIRKNRQLEPVFSGDVYVLTGADSFSSAMNFATLVSDNKLGTVIGEIPANMPSSYGDILRFRTPNAGLVFTVSYKYFIRPDADKSDIPLIPDVQVPAENAMEEAMRLITEKTNT
jgi:hypothetical protein